LALASEANIAGKTIVTYNLHLERKGDDQLRRFQLAEVLHDARRYNWGTSILLAGDVYPDVTCGPAASAISALNFRRIREPACADNTWLILRAGTNRRSDFYGGPFAPVNQKRIVLFRPATIIRCPSLWHSFSRKVRLRTT
jgi:hypothetical protein